MVDYIAFYYNLIETTNDLIIVQHKYIQHKKDNNKTCASQELGGVLLSLKCLSD